MASLEFPNYSTFAEPGVQAWTGEFRRSNTLLPSPPFPPARARARHHPRPQHQHQQQQQQHQQQCVCVRALHRIRLGGRLPPLSLPLTHSFAHHAPRTTTLRPHAGDNFLKVGRLVGLGVPGYSLMPLAYARRPLSYSAVGGPSLPAVVRLRSMLGSWGVLFPLLAAELASSRCCLHAQTPMRLLMHSTASSGTLRPCLHERTYLSANWLA